MFTVSAPGKVILFGEHAVVYDKAAVAVSLNLRTKLTVTRTFNSSIEVCMPDMSSSAGIYSLIELSLLGLNKSEPRNPKELSDNDLSILQAFVVKDDPLFDSQAIIALLFLYSYISGVSGPDSGFRFDVTTDLPIGAGLGSSASFSVCLSAAILIVGGVLHSGNKGQLGKEDLDLINKWAFMAEKIFHGRPSGIDNSICTYGGGLQYNRGQFDVVQMPSDLKIIVVNTKVPRKTKKIVADLRETYDQYPHILGFMFDAINSIADRCVAVLTEMAENGVTKENCRTLEDLMGLNHGLLRTMGVSHEKLENIVSTAAEFSLSAKMTGAGAGGFAFILLSPGTTSNSIGDLNNRLEQQGFQSWEVNIGGSGVLLQWDN